MRASYTFPILHRVSRLLTITTLLHVFSNLVLLVDNTCFLFNNHFLKKGTNSVMCACFKVMFIPNKYRLFLHRKQSVACKGECPCAIVS